MEPQLIANIAPLLRVPHCEDKYQTTQLCWLLVSRLARHVSGVMLGFHDGVCRLCVMCHKCLQIPLQRSPLVWHSDNYDTPVHAMRLSTPGGMSGSSSSPWSQSRVVTMVTTMSLWPLIIIRNKKQELFNFPKTGTIMTIVKCNTSENTNPWQIVDFIVIRPTEFLVFHSMKTSWAQHTLILIFPLARFVSAK